MNSLELIISDQAKEDLTEIWLYIAGDSPLAADKFLDLLYEKCRLLCDSPGIGRVRNELLPGVRSYPVKRYVVFYRVNSKAVEVVRILSGYRDIDILF